MSAKVPLKIAVATSGHTAAVKDGTIPIEGVEPNFVEVVPIIAAFRRMVRDVEFDVCEMAPTTYLIARARGAPYIALPIFVMRRFHHGGFVVRPDANIKVPKDLEGKQVGVRAYSVTTGVWTWRRLFGPAPARPLVPATSWRATGVVRPADPRTGATCLHAQRSTRSTSSTRW